MAAVDFIHPVIQAYMQGRQQALEKAQQVQQQGQFTQSQEQQKAEFEASRKQALQIADQAHELAQSQYDLQKQQAAVVNAHTGLQLLMQGAAQGADVQKLGGFLGGTSSQVPTLPSAGQQPTQQIPGVIGSGQPGTGVPGQPDPNVINLPGLGTSVDLSALGGMSPEAQGKRQLALAGGLKTAELGAEEPFQIAASTRARDNELSLETYRQGQENLRQGNLLQAQQTLEGLRQKGEMQRAYITTGPEYQRNLLEYGVTPDTAESRRYMLATGQERPTNSPQDKNIVAGLVRGGENIPNQKNIDTLKALDRLTPVFDRFQQFVDKLPSEKEYGSSFGAQVAAAGQRMVAQHAPFTTDLANEYGKVLGDVQLVSRDLEGFSGRPLAKQNEMEVGATPAMGFTREQGQDKLNRLKQMQIQRFNDEMKPFSSPLQLQDFHKAGIPVGPPQLVAPEKTQPLPDFLKIAPKTNANGTPLDVQLSIQVGHPAYRKAQ